MKRGLQLGIFAAALIALPVSAGTLYKCIGADGITSYASKKISGRQCEIISHYTSAKPRALPAASSSLPSVAPTQRGKLGADNAGQAAPVVVPKAASNAPAFAYAPKASALQRKVSGQVYSYVEGGVRHYTSARPVGVANVRTIQYSFIERCYACGNQSLDFLALRLDTVSYQTEVSAAAREFGVDEAIVRAVIHAESAYNPFALSRAGAQGLMQLMPDTARRFGVTDTYDASQNIRGGVQYLAWLLKRFNGDLTLAAAGYNAGEGAVRKHQGVPPYNETRRYVQRVGVLAERYRSAFAAH